MAVEIRAMNCCVANRACLILRGLVVKVRRPGSGAEGRASVALQAENVQIASLDQARIWRTVRRMTGHATFRLNRLVFEDKWPLFVRVARVAH